VNQANPISPRQSRDALRSKLFGWGETRNIVFRDVTPNTWYGRSTNPKYHMDESSWPEPLRYQQQFRAFRIIGVVGVIVGGCQMQIDNGNFDRWTNSVGGRCDVPETEQEFDAAVEFLLLQSYWKRYVDSVEFSRPKLTLQEFSQYPHRVLTRMQHLCAAQAAADDIALEEPAAKFIEQMDHVVWQGVAMFRDFADAVMYRLAFG
jgi:hypothetical protein